MRSTYLIRICIDPNQKNKFSKEQVTAEIFVNCCPGALNFTKEPEGKNAYGQANQRNNYSQLSDPCKNIIIFDTLRENNNKTVKRITQQLVKGTIPYNKLSFLVKH